MNARLLLPTPIMRGTARVGRTYPCAHPGCTSRVFSERPAGVAPADHVYPSPESVRCEAHAHVTQQQEA